MDTPSRQLPLASADTLDGCGLSYVVGQAGITLNTIALYTPQRLAVLVTDEPESHVPIMCPLLISAMSPIMLCELQFYVQLC